MFKMVLTQKGVTQTQLAKQMGISKNSLSDKVNGRTKIYTDEAKMICQILKIVEKEMQAEIFLN